MALFTTAEARAFKIKGEAPLSSASTYPDGSITDVAARLKEDFESICGVAFESTTSVVYTFDGDGGSEVWVSNVRVTAVSAATNDGTALTAGQLLDLKIYPFGRFVWKDGTWLKGNRNCSITFTHGFTAVPARIKWAALLLATEELTGSDITNRTISQSDELGTFRLATGDGVNRWYGIPAVDSVLRRYRDDHRLVV